jgi:hypothetical protein
LENVTEGKEYMTGIKNNTYEEKIEGSGKWVPVYQCKWFGSSETTWHFEDTIPPSLMEHFKDKRKSHYQSIKEFHKKRIEQQSKEQRKAERDAKKVQPSKDVPILSNYELQRQQTMAENSRMLKEMVTDPISMSPPKKKLRVTVTTTETPLLRRQPSRTCKDKDMTSAIASSSSSGSGSTRSSSASETTVSSAQSSSAESEYDSISSDEPLISYKQK